MEAMRRAARRAAPALAMWLSLMIFVTAYTATLALHDVVRQFIVR